MMKKAAEKGVKLLLPVDNSIGDEFSNDCNMKVVPVEDSGWLGRSGYRTGNSKTVCRRCKRCKDSCMERTDGMFRNAELRTRYAAVAKALAETDATTIIGGGDSAAAVNILDLVTR